MPTRMASTDTLLVRIRNPLDNEARREFFNVFAPFLYGCCRKRRCSPDLAEDVTQSVLIAFLRQEGFKLDRQKGTFRDYLAVCVIREVHAPIIKAKRAGQAAGGGVQDALLDAIGSRFTDASLSEEILLHLQRTAFARVRERTIARDWKVFLERRQGRTVEEIAVSGSMSLGHVSRIAIRVTDEIVTELRYLAEDHPAFHPPEC